MNSIIKNLIWYPSQWSWPWLAIIGGFLAAGAAAQNTETYYLSGHGKDDAVPWKFQCTSGAQSGYWTNLPVPSNWELHGFGTLNYHKDLTNAYDERGLYQYDFQVPQTWGGRRIFLVFDGVMTDTQVKLNGASAGPKHQGGYYRFKYEVTSMLRMAGTNHLEVTVAKHSANASVNGAERTGDYWMYGGIYRPVYLEAVPAGFVERVAIDAKANGHFAMDVFLNHAQPGDRVVAAIQNLRGREVGELFEAGVDARQVNGAVRLETQVKDPELWSAEKPNLYQVVVRLKRGDGLEHQLVQRFGFRTFEVRDGDGLYLNGQRIVLKGCNRHSFWPDSGRCLSLEVQRLDVETLKDMNMNAVRMSHYPPDADFLDLCDQQGLYVLDELAGWHKCYDTNVGPNLVQEMMVRDVNHPSILFWDNGNEGGFNTNLDHLFGEYDPQQRRVLHPWAPFNGLNTAHYLPFDFVKLAAQGVPITFHKNQYFADTNAAQRLIYLPTEFLHGLFDGGAGAGLADTWSLMEQSPYLGGGFIWAYLDEGVRHPDTGEIDVCGNEAPDGIVGPYREREASFYAIRDVWCPVEITEANLPVGFDGRLTVRNRYGFTNLKECQFHWRWYRLQAPAGAGRPREKILAEGPIEAPDVLPGQTGELRWDWPGKIAPANDDSEDYLMVQVADPTGRELRRYTWPYRRPASLADSAPVLAAATTTETAAGQVQVLTGKGLVARIDAQTGELMAVSQAGRTISLSHGPRAATNHEQLKRVTWSLLADGGLRCEYTYAAEGTNDYFGVTFDYPELLVKSKAWLGDGPYRVWQNRRAGVTPGFWQNQYNDTITGWKDWAYPEFKGCFANVSWLELKTSEGSIRLLNESGIPYLQVLNPKFPPAAIAGHTIPPLPQCGLGLLDAIPPIGSKFQAAQDVSPAGRPAVAHGDYTGSVVFYFGR